MTTIAPAAKYKVFPLGNCWAVDSSAKMTPALLDALASLDVHSVCADAAVGDPVEVIIRYIGLQGPRPGDIDAAELALILSHPRRYRLVLVQHVEAGSWEADGPTGLEHAKAAVACVQALLAAAQVSGDGALLTMVLDMESVRDPGPGALAYMQAWVAYVGAALGLALRIAPAVYEGFDAGVTGQQLLDANVPLWADYGPRVLPGGATFTAKQHPQVSVHGVYFDFDRLSVDSRGQQFAGLGLDDSPPEDEMPHTDPSPQVNVQPTGDPDATVKPS